MSAAASVGRDLARTMADCALAHDSGILTARRGKLKRLFCLEDGALVFAASNVIEEQFSEVLVREGLVSVGDLAGAQRASDEQRVGLARMLVSQDVVAVDAMAQALELHVRELLFATLDWPDGESTLDRGRPDLDGEITTRLPCARLLVEYARAHPDSIEAVQKRIGSATTRLVAREERSTLLEQIELEPTARYVLSSCDGESRIADIIEHGPAEAEATWRSLYALWLLGIVEPVRTGGATEGHSRDEIEAELRRTQGADYYTVLDVPHHAAPERIREAYYRRARDFHPDRFRTGPLQDLRERIEVYFASVTEAYNTLHDSRLRADYDTRRAAETEKGPEQDTAYLARENYRRAMALITKGRFTDALTSLENAIQLDARNAVYRLEAGKLMARNPRLRRQAEEQLVQVNRIDPSLVEGYLELGELYLKTQRRDAAVRMFDEVLRWEPDHVQAKLALRRLRRL